MMTSPSLSERHDEPCSSQQQYDQDYEAAAGVAVIADT